MDARGKGGPGLELKHLRCLVAIVDTGGFTDAALELGVSQAAVSRTLRALEKTLGVRLLHRTSRTVEPTAAGARVLTRARPLLAGADELVAEAASGRSRLNIGHAWSAFGPTPPSSSAAGAATTPTSSCGWSATTPPPEGSPKDCATSRSSAAPSTSNPGRTPSSDTRTATWPSPPTTPGPAAAVSAWPRSPPAPSPSIAEPGPPP
ncbi:DNA-binding MarR family transcriptional regulator [Streptomonospora nanhaiensis]|uniref:DNA-binding MarR family transcriptional regulator n=1 Tax=Streptomonospora nanhaiensis TaxID=1323731 RepID=A0A853BK62_9ACTN|nr:DNA-binding MarR family transcriptional regulator [Streptomonospora nanhaiensis]